MHISMILDSNAAKVVTAELTDANVNFRGIVLYCIAWYCYVPLFQSSHCDKSAGGYNKDPIKWD